AHMEPDVLLVDEVLSVGDWAFQRKCVEKMGSFVRNGITIVFISHNLQAVASLCNRTLLINQGSIVANGPTENVVIHYLQNAMLPSKLQEVKPQIWIKEVNVYNQDTQLMGHFKSGENVKIDVEIVSQTYERNLALGIYILDQNYYSVFNTSSERLGYRTFSIRNGEVLRLRFNVCLHLCQGTYYLGAIIKRYDIDKTFDTKFPAATLLLNSDEGVRGVANLYPTFMIGKK
ncbi:TPA: ABC transporter ATP-binding protein, partial [Candidatus Bathyarchaeota archaeon]|nr:ABC transporter ATP-binding protein [Candidatus Bathyarchaeota archaeon]